MTRAILLISTVLLSSPASAESLGIDLRPNIIQHTVIRNVRSVDANGNVIGGSPEGCPRTSFCGCALALKVFGHHVRDLWKASSWFRYPRTYAQSGMVAVTSRHVFLLLSHVEGTRWLSYDPNSGNHLTRIHERDIRGTTIVDPRGVRVAGWGP